MPSLPTFDSVMMLVGDQHTHYKKLQAGIALRTGLTLCKARHTFLVGNDLDALDEPAYSVAEVREVQRNKDLRKYKPPSSASAALKA